jgi:hypothetical protein
MQRRIAPATRSVTNAQKSERKDTRRNRVRYRLIETGEAA